MTNYVENLDAILTEYRISYLNDYNKGDYMTCAELLYTRNCAHPPDAWLKDMPRFVIRSNSLRTLLNIKDKAKAYCDYWNPKLEMAMAEFRAENQDQYNQI
jgi:hypothetical protein